MVRLISLFLTFLLFTSAEAHSHRHHVAYKHHPHHRHIHRRSHHVHPSSYLVTVPTAAGIPITVARHLAPRFQALIADFVAHGYTPRRIGCYASYGHVPNSRHYAGAACDFDGSLSRSPFMRSYIAAKIIQKHHFRNGCSFVAPFYGIRDCGHVDDGRRRVRRWYSW